MLRSVTIKFAITLLFVIFSAPANAAVFANLCGFVANIAKKIAANEELPKKYQKVWWNNRDGKPYLATYERYQATNDIPFYGPHRYTDYKVTDYRKISVEEGMRLGVDKIITIEE